MKQYRKNTMTHVVKAEVSLLSNTLHRTPGPDTRFAYLLQGEFTTDHNHENKDGRKCLFHIITKIVHSVAVELKDLFFPFFKT